MFCIGGPSMPKEQPCLSEQGPRMSSKKAKDKSNSATLLTLRCTADTDGSNGRDSRCSSEKDSGYSDYSSDWQQTDTEDQQSSVSQPRAAGRDQRAPEQAQVQGLGWGRAEQVQGLGRGRAEQPPRLQESPVLVPNNSEFAPIYVLNNVVLKQLKMVQSGGDQTRLIWGSGRGEASSSGEPRVILLQQPSAAPASPASPQLRKPLSRRIHGTGRKTNVTYLPILNSYPCIAPHPSKKPPDKTSHSQDSQGQSKRVRTEDERDEASATSSLRKHHPRKQSQSRVFTSVLPCAHSYSNNDASSPSSPIAVSSSLGSPSISCTSSSSSSSSPLGSPSISRTSSSSSPLHNSSSPLGSPSISRTSSSSPSSSSPLHNSSSPLLAARGPRRSSLPGARHRRFLNTVEILSQSGLLDITLRTQELLRQSKAADRDITQLRQHTQLLCQAANAPGNSLDGKAAWEQLCRAMAESGEYPCLKILQDQMTNSEPDSAGPSDPGSERYAGGRMAAWIQVATPMPDQNRNCLVPQLSMVNSTCPLSLSEQGRQYKASGKPSDKVSIMPPDSSTSGDVL